MDSRDTAPLYSRHADDPAAAEALDAFVVGLAERVDALQDADADGELEVILRDAERMAEDANAVGHDVLADVATRVADTARLRKAEDVHSVLVELTFVAQRVRRGHRGAI